MSTLHVSESQHMTATPSPRPGRALSPASRSPDLQRIFARLQDGAGYADIAAEEGFSRERLRQIVRAATAGSRLRRAGHKRMQIARLTPALRLAADGVARGDAKSIPLLLQIIDRLDRYSNPPSRISARPSCSWNGDASHPRGAENRRE